MERLMGYAIGTFLALLPVTNPVGVIPTFYSLTSRSSSGIRNRQAKQVATNVIIVLTTFLVAGRPILDFFGISLGVLQIAGGLLLGKTAWEMLDIPQDEMVSDSKLESANRDITLIPLAIPMISGPGAIGMVIGLVAKDPRPENYLGSLLGIFVLGLSLYLSLVLGEPLVRFLGKGGVTAFTRVLAFFILAIAIQFITDGAFALLGKSEFFP